MIVLDSTALLAWLDGQDRLSDAALAAIELELKGGDVAISVISVLDISQYIDDGRLQLSVSKRNWLSLLPSIEGLRVVPVDMAIALRAATLSSVLPSHQRLIAATAIAHGAALITLNARLREFGYAEAIW